MKMLAAPGSSPVRLREAALPGSSEINIPTPKPGNHPNYRRNDMDIIRFNLRIATVTKNGNCIEYSHDGERRRLKTPDDIRAIVEEMIKIAFPPEE